MVPRPDSTFSDEAGANNTTEDFTITSGIRKYPSHRNELRKNPEQWLIGKRKDDAVHPYWRVHNKLYDLSNFINKHPGGKFWIEDTRGTDITESFESSHFGPVPEKLLKKYYVKDITTPRNMPFTFEENGFFKTLKRKVTPILEKVGRGPTWHMLFVQDSLLAGFIGFAILAALKGGNLFYCTLSGVFLPLMIASAHNFFHQRDNWRMHIFDLSMISSREWRISHVLSHHNFPNTIIDYEISAFEPFLKFLPTSSKSFIDRYAVILTSPLIYIIGFYLDTANKFILSRKGESKYVKCDCLPLIELIVMIFLSGSILLGLKTWFIIHTVGNVIFLFIGLTAAHHHPEIFHEGDAAPKQKDWGLHQVLATRDRGGLFMNSVLLASVSFGNHTLHHLLPTVDQSKLHYLQEAFLETCKEFNVKFDVYTPWELFKGCYKQLAKNKPNSNTPSILK